MTRLIFILSSIIIIILDLNAQTFEDMHTLPEVKGLFKYKKAVAYGDEFYGKRWFSAASKYYMFASDKRKKHADIAFAAGESLRKIRNYELAETYYKRAVQYKKNFETNMMLYRYAEMMKVNGKTDSALVLFERFMRTYEVGFEDEFFFAAENNIKGCQLIYKNQMMPTLFTTNNNIGEINTLANENGATIANSDGDFLYNTFSKSNGLLRVSMSKRISDSHYGEGRLIAKTINLPNHSTGYPCLNADKNEMYFSKCYEDDTTKYSCSIYRTKYMDDRWSEAVSISGAINNGGSVNIQPHITTGFGEQEVLYFTSNRDNGKGGFDIWYSVRLKDGTFTSPRNAGIINTPGDEFTPFYLPKNEIMFFSSNFHPGLGNLDVFKANGYKDVWKDIENLGAPINTTADDYYFKSNNDITSGVLSSNRKGVQTETFATAADDIFSFTLSEQPKLTLIVQALNKNDRTQLEAVEIKLYEIGEDKQRKLIHKSYTDPYFTFPIERMKSYLIEAENASYYPTQNYINSVFKNKTSEVVFDVLMSPR